MKSWAINGWSESFHVHVRSSQSGQKTAWLHGSLGHAAILHDNRQSKCSVANVPCIMCHHMLRTTVTYFNSSSAALLKSEKEISPPRLWFSAPNTRTFGSTAAHTSSNLSNRFWTPVDQINTTIFSLFPWTLVSANQQLLLVAMEIFSIAFDWTLRPQLIVWWYKWAGAIIINMSASCAPWSHLCSCYCFTAAR